MAPPPSSGFTVDRDSMISLGIAFALMPTAQLLASQLLPKNVRRAYYLLFIWHAYDALTHLILEGSYLYQCFFSWAPTSRVLPRAHSSVPVLWDHRDRHYGAAYGEGPFARLWQEYAKADTRWAGADLTVISLEILTVFLGGPAAIYVCVLLTRIANAKPSAAAKARGLQVRLWFVTIILATAELYGGWITFAPEWFSGSTLLVTSDPVYLWLYLFFFNTLWVFIPFWVIYVAYSELQTLSLGPSVAKKNA